MYTLATFQGQEAIGSKKKVRNCLWFYTDDFIVWPYKIFVFIATILCQEGIGTNYADDVIVYNYTFQ